MPRASSRPCSSRTSKTRSSTQPCPSIHPSHNQSTEGRLPPQVMFALPCGRFWLVDNSRACDEEQADDAVAQVMEVIRLVIMAEKGKNDVAPLNRRQVPHTPFQNFEPQDTVDFPPLRPVPYVSIPCDTPVWPVRLSAVSPGHADVPVRAGGPAVSRHQPGTGPARAAPATGRQGRGQQCGQHTQGLVSTHTTAIPDLNPFFDALAT